MLDGEDRVLHRVADVRRYFPLTRGILKRRVGWIKAVDGVSLSLQRGKTFGLVGESGCGKTTLSRLILGIDKPSSGVISFEGTDIHTASSAFRRRYRSLVQVVFQDPFSSLNPRMRVGPIIGEPLRTNASMDRAKSKARVEEVLELVGLRPSASAMHPHQFSGGERQRIAIARALAPHPQVLLLDEPVASLDVSVRAQVLNLFMDFQEKFGYTYLFISHDLAAVRYLSHRIGVMYLGKLVEVADAKELYREPLHPYTRALLESSTTTKLSATVQDVVTGEVPSPIEIPSGCRFRTRCPFVMAKCATVEPELREHRPGHWAACHLYA